MPWEKTKYVIRPCRYCGKPKGAYQCNVDKGKSVYCNRECFKKDMVGKQRRKPVPVEERFWRFTSKSDGCWEWTGARNKKGYGTINVGGTTAPAYRLSWMMANGQKIPRGAVIAHHCDNPPCVRPDHLFLTDHAGNARDRHAKGRSNPQHGEQHCFAKLTDASVREIKEMLKQGVRQRIIAEQFNVARTAISAISAGRNWKHVT